MRYRYRCTACGRRFEGRPHADGSIHASFQALDRSAPLRYGLCVSCRPQQEPQHETVGCCIEEIELEGDHGPVPSVFATCSKCGHETESFGTDEPSRIRCLALMREECPMGEQNYYVDEDAP